MAAVEFASSRRRFSEAWPDDEAGLSAHDPALTNGVVQGVAASV